MAQRPSDLVKQIHRWETNKLEQNEELELFHYLVDSGISATPQGSFQRHAQALIDAGMLTPPAYGRGVEA